MKKFYLRLFSMILCASLLIIVPLAEENEEVNISPDTSHISVETIPDELLQTANLDTSDIEITDFNIKGELLAKNEAVKNELDAIDSEEISDEEKASKKEQYHYITREDAIKNCIDFWVQVSEADKRGIVKSLDDSKQFAKDNLDMIKEGAQNGDSNCIEELSKIEEYNKTIGQTEEDYINNGAEMLVNAAKITQLRNQVVDSFSDEQKQNEDEEYQKFVDELVKKATIEWK